LFSAELRQFVSAVNWFSVEPHRFPPRGNRLAAAVNGFVSPVNLFPSALHRFTVALKQSALHRAA
jgi:hypothetical protein